MTSEEEHLSQTETDHVTQEAKEHRDENEVNKTKVEAKNGLENHCATTRSTSIVEQMKSKFEVGHKKPFMFVPGTGWTRIGGGRNSGV